MTRRRSGLDPIDIRIGETLRGVRMRQGMSMEALGRAVGVSYQQIQKYESGGNRISASKLSRIAKVLDCELSVFFHQFAATDDPDETGMVYDAEDVRATRALQRIEDRVAQDCVRKLIDRLGELGDFPRRG